MRDVAVVALGQVRVEKVHQESLPTLAAGACWKAMNLVGVEMPDALYVSNMLSDELQGQKHLGALIADELRLQGIEAFEIRAATASGAAALRVGYLAVASGALDLALVVGVEKMGEGIATPALAKALDAREEVPNGATLLSQNARLMQLYFDTYHPPADALAHFSVNAHLNAAHNEYALFRNKGVGVHEVMSSRLIIPPLRLYDCSPICEGAAAILLAPMERAREFTSTPVHLAGSAASTDRFRISDRPAPLSVKACQESAAKALGQASLGLDDVDFFELHDAFSIMACLALEAVGFAEPGRGWRLAVEGEIQLNGRIPICTMGGLKARGHPIGASAIYQVCEIFLQLTGQAGANQVPNAQVALMQSVGGVASTVISHIFKV